MNEYEVNLSPLLGLDLWPLIGSYTTHGANAGARAWTAAQNAAKGLEILTDEQAAKFVDMVRSSGMELGADTPKVEIVALFLQWVTSDLREIGCDEVADLTVNLTGDISEGSFFTVLGVPYFQIS